MASSYVSCVPSLPQGSDEKYGGHPLESTKRDEVLRPLHAHTLKGHRVSCVWIDVDNCSCTENTLDAEGEKGFEIASLGMGESGDDNKRYDQGVDCRRDPIEIRVLIMAIVEVIMRIATARGSKRLKSLARFVWITREFAGKFSSVVKYEVQDLATAAVPMMLSRIKLAAAMNAAKSPSSTLKYANEPPATGISTANSV
ncbi:hypothetical protein ACMD2_02078 [Ananas comosus]|uniref:Uncharacterized protein n=1 Tax=Ananas comosus TaxID=4615 RepID=A0A199W5A6_ANACO|nr:hypothetical protein ACMD2_02078 [Ananas comosus]